MRIFYKFDAFDAFDMFHAVTSLLFDVIFL